MLVMICESSIIAPHQVCQGCLMADHSGEPRWKDGQLRCGHAIAQNQGSRSAPRYECDMGFQLADVQ